jgi:hypothetical protein
MTVGDRLDLRWSTGAMSTTTSINATVALMFGAAGIDVICDLHSDR